MTAANTLLALYDLHSDLWNAVKDLREAGCNMSRVSVVAKRYHVQNSDDGRRSVNSPHEWYEVAPFWCDLWNMLPGAAFLTVPDIGAVLVAGPFAFWAIGSLEQAQSLPGLTSLGGGLLSLAVPKSGVEDCVSALDSDKIVLIAAGPESETSKIQEVLSRTTYTKMRVYDQATSRLIGVASKVD